MDEQNIEDRRLKIVKIGWTIFVENSSSSTPIKIAGGWVFEDTEAGGQTTEPFKSGYSFEELQEISIRRKEWDANEWAAPLSAATKSGIIEEVKEKMEEWMEEQDQ